MSPTHEPDATIDPVAARRAKLRALLKAGIDPYPVAAHQHTPAWEVVAHCEAHCPNPEDEDATEFAVAGRLRAIRGQGKIVFMDVLDRTGKVQVVAKADAIKAPAELLENLDIGDIIYVKGTTFRTKRGECSLLARELELLSKALRPLPDKWHGLKDHETRYRQRYVDLIMNEEVRKLFELRSTFIHALRHGLATRGFLEVETPVLEHIPGGADAEPFVTKHDTLDIDLYLRISLELHLKRLLVGGLERVFEMGRVFRNEGMSPQHLQEFTMLEFYMAYSDYQELMTMVEALYAEALHATFGTTKIERAGKEPLDFTPPLPRVSYVALLKEHAGIDILSATDEELLAAVKKHRVDTDLSLGRARLIDQLYKKTVRPKLTGVYFLIDPPLELSPLAKPHRDNPKLAERFWVVADTAEIGNAFSELNDPIDQKERFSEQEKLRLAGDKEAQRMDHDYVRALEYGMPPAAGFGVGIDRMLAVVTGQESIRDVVLFPTMKPEK